MRLILLQQCSENEHENLSELIDGAGYSEAAPAVNSGFCPLSL